MLPGQPQEAAAAASGGATGTPPGWQGWAPLERRMRLLQQDADELTLSSRAIDEALRRDR
jgi:hypothetical protein